MTRTTNAKLAGVTTVGYLVAGIGTLAVAGRPPAGAFNLLESFSALVLGVTLYALTREQDRDIALIAMMSRVIEAVPGEGFIYAAVGTLLFCWLLLRGRMIPVALASLGVVASALLVLMIVAQRAGGAVVTNWSSPVTWLIALPMLVFELAFATWLLTKGVAAATPRAAYGKDVERSITNEPRR
jgi:hypothetical protein